VLAAAFVDPKQDITHPQPWHHVDVRHLSSNLCPLRRRDQQLLHLLFGLQARKLLNHRSGFCFASRNFSF
jgi:hypothetical protein